jgi:hypothetical protein
MALVPIRMLSPGFTATAGSSPSSARTRVHRTGWAERAITGGTHQRPSGLGVPKEQHGCNPCGFGFE